MEPEPDYLPGVSNPVGTRMGPAMTTLLSIQGPQKPLHVK